MRSRRISSAIAILALTGAVTACSAPYAGRNPTFALSPDAVPRSSPRSTAAPATPEQLARMAVIRDGPCAGAVTAYPVGPAEPEQLGGFSLPVPHVRDPMPHANGEVRRGDLGTPGAYVVADDDVFETVAARLCLPEQYLRAVNAVRRDGDALYAGDVLNLDAHTIRTVGDQNGAVADNPLPDGLTVPPQR